MKTIFENFSKNIQLRAKHPLSLVLYLLVWFSALLAIAAFVLLVGFILVRGLPNISIDLFAWKYTSDNVSLVPALVNTVTMVLFALLVAAPLGIFSAIYMVEYARRGNRLVKVVRTTAETLSGIPSIVYGLFGLLFFVVALGWGYSMVAGALTLAIMILPVIMRTTEEALKAVPDSYREGSFGLGAGKLRTIFRIVLPAAIPGILGGIVLSIGRIVGETAALLYTAGSVAGVPNSLMGSGRTLSVHMYILASENLHTGKAYATAVVLLFIVFLLNAASSLLAKRIQGGNNG